MLRSLVLALALACGPRAPSATAVPVESRIAAEAAFEVVSEPVTWDADGAIHGTLTRPGGEGAFPAVLLIQGSGPTDRDWNNPLVPGDNGSGKLLAEALSARGVVVLRYDKRGTGETALDGPLTWDLYTDEQRGGLATLATRPEVDTERIFVMGHSEGTLHALRLAPDPGTPVAGIVLLCPPGRTFRDLTIHQLKTSLRLQGLSVDAIDAEIARYEAGLDQIRDGGTPSLDGVENTGVKMLLAAFGDPRGAGFSRPLLDFDPPARLAEVDEPVLVLMTGKDIQIDPVLDRRPLQAVADAHDHIELVMVTNADHVLKHQELPPALAMVQGAQIYNHPDRELDADVLAAIVTWLRARTGGGDPPQP